MRVFHGSESFLDFLKKQILHAATAALLALLLADIAAAQRSPFDGLRWADSVPEVKIEQEWYRVDSIAGHDCVEILEYCERTYGRKARKRFAEDLIDVMAGLGTEVGDTVDVVAIDLDSNEKVPFTGLKVTREKRQAIRMSLRAGSRENVERAAPAPELASTAAIADLREFGELLARESSYLFLHGDLTVRALAEFEEALGKRDSISMQDYSLELTRILGFIGDRHSKIYPPEGVAQAYDDAYLPFALAPLGERAIAVVRAADSTYAPYDSDFPFLVKVDGRPLSEWVDDCELRGRFAPPEAKWYRALSLLPNMGRSYYIAGRERPKRTKLTFSNGGEESEREVELAPAEVRWRPMDNTSIDEHADAAAIDSLFRMVEGDIGYIRIPSMWDEEEQPGFFRAIPERMREFRGTRALIIDIRHNGGGVRHLLMRMSPYFIGPDASPWVGNVAHVRLATPVAPGVEIGGMDGRFLYQRSSDALDSADRESIDAFAENFEAR